MTAKAVLGLLQGQKKDASGVVPAVTSQPEKGMRVTQNVHSWRIRRQAHP